MLIKKKKGMNVNNYIIIATHRNNCKIYFSLTCHSEFDVII